MTTTPPIWRTQLMGCIIAAHKGGGDDASSLAVKVPTDGWYGLFFGRSNPSHPSHPNTPRSKRRYVMSLIPPETNGTRNTATSSSSTTDSRSVSFPLPLLYEMGALEHHPSSSSSRGSRRNQHHREVPNHSSITGSSSISSSHTVVLDNINTGKLIYCTAECTVFVRSQQEPYCHTDSKVETLDETHLRQPITDDDGTKNYVDDSDTAVWCLVHQRSNLSILDTSPLIGTVASVPKSLVCRYCMRSFPSLRGIHSHIHERHEKQQLIPVLRPPLLGAMKRSRSISSSQDMSYDNDLENVTSLYEKPLEVVFQDAYMAIVVKPQGMPVMGGKPSLLRCDLLMALVCTSAETELLRTTNINTNTARTVDGIFDSALGKPRPVHRLDSATGGLLVVAKTHRAERTLRLAFQNRTCHKRYRAIVVGKLCPVRAAAAAAASSQALLPQQVLVTVEQNRGVIDSPVSGKQSQSLFQVVRHVPCTRHGGYLTVVDLWPVTGRKHQLRKHMKVIGHHILGDVRHCGKSKAVQAGDFNSEAATTTMKTPATTSLVDTSSRLCLWAVEITLPHPITGMDVAARMTDPDWIEIVTSQEEQLYVATCDK